MNSSQNSDKPTIWGFVQQSEDKMIEVLNTSDRFFHERRASEEAAAAECCAVAVAKTAHLELSWRHLAAARQGYIVYDDPGASTGSLGADGR